MRRMALILTLLGLLGDVNGWGNSILDPPIFVGSPACPAPPGCPIFGNEVNGITGNTFTLDQAGGTSTAVLGNPVLMMIGVPNVGGTFSAPSITLSMGTGSLGGTPPVSVLNWSTTTGFANTMTSGGQFTNAYSAIGVADPNAADAGNSESFVNWSSADSAVLKITATNFGVYVYELNNSGLSGHPSSVNVTFGSALPFGTFIVAYGCATSWGTPLPCSGGDIYATPFTQVGLEVAPGTQRVPEPGSLTLLGAGLISLLGFARRFKS